MGRWAPPFTPVSHQAELEELLARDRSQAPDQASIDALVPILQKTLDRQFIALESLDRKAAVLLGAILGIGFLTSDRLRIPDGLAIAPFLIALVFSLGAVGACLVVLWSRSLLTGPKPIKSAQETGWTQLPFTQSIVDSLAVAAQENTGVNEVKGAWLNFAFTAATIAVTAFVVLGLSGALP